MTVPVRQQIVKAVVLKITRQVPRELRSKLKDVLSVDKKSLGFSPPQINTIEKLADYYGASQSEIAYHALAFPSPIVAKSAKPAAEKPLFVQAPWLDRVKFYQRIIKKYAGKKRLVFIFAVESYTAEFTKTLNSEVESFSDGLNATQNRALNAAIVAQKSIIVAGGPKWSFFPLAVGDVLVIDQPDHIGLTSQRRPFLSAKQIGLTRVITEGVQLVLGADAPSISDYLHFQDQSWRFLCQKLPPKEITIFTKARSNELLLPNFADELTESAEKGKKILVFAASRGFAGALYCRECAEIQNCPKCDRPVGLKNEQELLCHYCGFIGPKPTKCPKGHSAIINLGEGITQVSAVITQLLPKTAVAELNNTADSLPSAQVIVATEKVLSFPSFKFDSIFIAAADRLLAGVSENGAWHLLTLLLALRSKTTKIFIQTRFPNHWVWSALGTGKIDEFYTAELAERKKYRLPPFGQELNLVGQGRHHTQLESQAATIIKKVEQAFPSVTISQLPFRFISDFERELTVQLYRANHFTSAEKHRLRSLLPPSWTIVIS